MTAWALGAGACDDGSPRTVCFPNLCAAPPSGNGPASCTLSPSSLTRTGARPRAVRRTLDVRVAALLRALVLSRRWWAGCRRRQRTIAIRDAHWGRARRAARGAGSSRVRAQGTEVAPSVARVWDARVAAVASRRHARSAACMSSCLLLSGRGAFSMPCECRGRRRRVGRSVSHRSRRTSVPLRRRLRRCRRGRARVSQCASSCFAPREIVCATRRRGSTY